MISRVLLCLLCFFLFASPVWALPEAVNPWFMPSEGKYVQYEGARRGIAFPKDFIPEHKYLDLQGRLWVIGRNYALAPVWLRLRNNQWQIVDSTPIWQLFRKMMAQAGFAANEIPASLKQVGPGGSIYCQLAFTASGQAYLRAFHYSQEVAEKDDFELIPLKAGFVVRRTTPENTAYRILNGAGQFVRALSLPRGLRLEFEDAQGQLWARNGNDWYRFREGQVPVWVAVRGAFIFEDSQHRFWFGDYPHDQNSYGECGKLVVQRYQNGKISWAELPDTDCEMPYVRRDSQGRLFWIFDRSAVIELDQLHDEFRYMPFHSLFISSIYGGKGPNYDYVAWQNKRLFLRVFIYDSTCVCPVGYEAVSLPPDQIPKQKIVFSDTPPVGYKPCSGCFRLPAEF